MGFSKEIFEQYRREVRIMWRVLAVGAVIAGSAHFLSLPFISRLISVATGDAGSETEATPIEIVVEEEVAQVAKEPEPELPKEQIEPAASADRPSAAPLATNNEPVPLSDVAAANTVAVAPSVATENGEVGGEGAVGESSAIGLVPGSGEPIVGDRINLPDTSPEPRPRQRVEETSLAARNQSTSRVVSCNPCSVPDYPGNARRNQAEGQPVINIIFDENGRVVSAEIEVTSGNEAFDQAALEEARRNWRFQDSQGTGGQVSVDVTYVVRDSDQYEEAQQAGEVLAVELPAQQRIQPVTSEQAPVQPTSASPPVATPDDSAPNAASSNDAEPASGSDGDFLQTGETTVETSSEGNAPTENLPTEAAEPSPEAPVSPEPVAPTPAPPAPVSPEPAPPAPEPMPLPAVPAPQPEPLPEPLPAAPPASEPASSAEPSPEIAQ